MQADLRAVKRAASRRASAEASYRDAIRQAHAAGQSLRAIAEAAGVTHVRILQIVREQH